ncbi:hypothetical protein LEP1GSC043_3692 [Leptospira weilii str. Ecochallenge]|uniref:Uncharacterized protein n=1 Tax=Leptospira weilii str. Ecochallenge TaxID=1049986 RepID=N1TVD8_9LEPT|nr:hypothetical protein LEP1GSC043_3692 [Leptospira weilii str. Ecochallenge]
MKTFSCFVIGKDRGSGGIKICFPFENPYPTDIKRKFGTVHQMMNDDFVQIEDFMRRLLRCKYLDW